MRWYASEISEPVKPRRYESPRRRAQAAATRREILDAAQRLFEERGYAATTIAAIAEAAGVAPRTVSLAFETKAGVLRALWNVRLRGDDDEAPVAQRAWYREVLDEPDPERKLRLNARNSRAVKSRVGALLNVVRAGAQADPDVAALWDRIENEFHANQRRIVETLHAAKALRRGLDVDRAADVLWALNHPDVWRLLVVERGWTPEQYERWFRESATAQLLRR
ncbi:MAG TPA: TetR family transcriptional regulator [Solirubrobacteraceae bacterium]